MTLPLCVCCGRPQQIANQLCSRCETTTPAYHTVRAATHFNSPISETIHQLKYYNCFALAQPLARLMVESWEQWMPSETIDLVVPVPLHSERQKERGYNQSALLGYHFAHLIARPYAENLLKRTRYTEPQAQLKAQERLANVADAFAYNRGEVIDKHILLIDDVCTTGATLDAAAHSLLKAGASKVSAYCLARAA